MSDEVKTFTMMLGGREITFRNPALGQVLLLHRMYAKAIKRAEGDEQDASRQDVMSDAMVRVLDYVESLIVSEDDRAFVEDGLWKGDIDFTDVLKALSGGKREDAAAADDEAPVNRAAKRAKKAVAKTPKATAAKAAYKSVGSRARTQR